MSTQRRIKRRLKGLAKNDPTVRLHGGLRDFQRIGVGNYRVILTLGSRRVVVHSILDSPRPRGGSQEVLNIVSAYANGSNDDNLGRGENMKAFRRSVERRLRKARHHPADWRGRTQSLK